METDDYLDDVKKRGGLALEILLEKKDYAKKIKDLKRLANVLHDNLGRMGQGVAMVVETKDVWQIVLIPFPEKKLKYVLGEFLPTMGVIEKSINIYKDGKLLDIKDVKKKL